ncbi:MAG: hypothetical protein JF564_07300 [Sphingomonas sp.]|nr:hypothetical protein [Sphingomonas sp.]
MIEGSAALILSMLMVAAILLGAGGIWLLAKGRDRKRGILMLVAAIVMFANVLIWAWPMG